MDARINHPHQASPLMNEGKKPEFDSSSLGSSKILSPRKSFRDPNSYESQIPHEKMDKALEPKLMYEIEKLVKRLMKRDFS